MLTLAPLPLVPEPAGHPEPAAPLLVDDDGELPPPHAARAAIHTVRRMAMLIRFTVGPPIVANAFLSTTARSCGAPPPVLPARAPSRPAGPAPPPSRRRPGRCGRSGRSRRR